MKLETKRLILRTPKMSDWKDILEGIGDIDVSRNLSNVPHPYKKKDAIWWLNKQKKDWSKRNPTSREFVIVLKSENKVIGASGFCRIDKFTGTATSGSWIAKKYWRKGYITEAKLALNDFAFNKLNLQRLESEAFLENAASNGMSKFFGYKFEGTKRRAHRSKATKKWHDNNIYGLLKEEWKIHRKKLINK